ncbi:MAG: hypothetical protein QNJ12_02690 [Ilumatobacter sp.]|uniref:hypothetical protein n=1 Tax=Ilumatobacter sp. TaxID=1967498 RepID=UPI002612D562|nr:hypothetical protein [Ilumatobacter sp.]MDJ0767666.1 hypothetical protein [Ilumatobacter sp.]
MTDGSKKATRDVAAEIAYDSNLTSDELTDAIDVTEANVRKVVPTAQVIHIEPDLHHDDDVDSADRIGVHAAAHGDAHH